MIFKMHNYLTYEMHKCEYGGTDRHTCDNHIKKKKKTYVFSSDHHVSVIHLYIYMSVLKYDKRILKIVMMKTLIYCISKYICIQH